MKNAPRRILQDYERFVSSPVAPAVPVAVSLRDLNRSLARNARYKQISYGPTLCRDDTIKGKLVFGLINVLVRTLFRLLSSLLFYKNYILEFRK